MKDSFVSIVVPNKNSAHLMKDFFLAAEKSINKNFEIIVNDDVASTDNLKELCAEFKSKGLNIVYIQENKSMAQGRVSGAKHAKGEILIHLDSDMRISNTLIGECIQKIESGYDALVIPEESYGEGFWAKVKWLEKKCYDNVEWMESLRMVKKDIYEKLGGHNEKMVFSEDKDFDIRVKEAGYKVGRTESDLMHYEGRLMLWKTMKKKMGYSNTSNVFALAHPEHFNKQANIFLRYVLFLKNLRYLFTNPFLYLGLWFLKTCEFGASATGLILKKLNFN